MKMGMELHGMMPKHSEGNINVENINYNLDVNKLGDVFNKLAEVSRKLDFCGYPKGEVQDGVIVERNNVERNMPAEKD
jgi:hypothetical protein